MSISNTNVKPKLYVGKPSSFPLPFQGALNSRSCAVAARSSVLPRRTQFLLLLLLASSHDASKAPPSLEPQVRRRWWKQTEEGGGGEKGLLERATATCLTVRVITSAGLFCVSERIISAPERCDPLTCTHMRNYWTERPRNMDFCTFARGGDALRKTLTDPVFPSSLFLPPFAAGGWLQAAACGEGKGETVSRQFKAPVRGKKRGDLSTATVPLLSGGGASWRKSPRTRTEKGGERGRRKRTWKSGIFFSTASHLMQWREGGRFSDMKTGLGKRVMKLPPPPPLVIAVRKLPNSRAIPSFY